MQNESGLSESTSGVSEKSAMPEFRRIVVERIYARGNCISGKKRRFPAPFIASSFFQSIITAPPKYVHSPPEYPPRSVENLRYTRDPPHPASAADGTSHRVMEEIGLSHRPKRNPSHFLLLTFLTKIQKNF